MTAKEWASIARRVLEVRERMPRPALWALNLATAGAAWGYGAMALQGLFGALSLFLLPVLWACVLLVLGMTLRTAVGPVGVLRRVLGRVGGRVLGGESGLGAGGLGRLAAVALGLSPERRWRIRLCVLVVLGGPAGLFVAFLPWVLQTLCVAAVALHLALRVAGPLADLVADRAEDGSGGTGGDSSGDSDTLSGAFPGVFPSPNTDSRGPRREE